MIDDTNSEAEAFLRQRRNLLAVSLFLLFYELSGFKFKEISILGTSMEISDPSFVTVILWLALGYFVLRFYQVHPGNIWWRQILERRDRLAVRESNRILLQELARDIGTNELRPQDIEIGHIGTLRPGWRFIANGIISWSNGPGKVLSRKLENYEFELRPHDIPWLRLRSLLHITLKTPCFTEYALPFVVAALPLFTVLGRLLVRCLAEYFV